ncbi:MAG TPA: protein kinase [Nocardioidaceae bacterium]
MPFAELGHRYALEQLIARGGMADVYRATDRRLSRPVAVKQLRDVTSSPAEQARFTAEARTLSRLNHPGLVTVLDAGVDDDRPFLVMDLVPGPTLADRCCDGPLPPEEVADVGAQVADALAFAHEAGVVHRDVKPANVLLGGDGRVRLADFGIARVIGDSTRHTGTGLTIGTAAYLSPEQVRGTEVGPAADVYALGLVLLECLTGTCAYSGPPVEAALARLTRPVAIPEALPPAWRRLLREMTAAEPAQRPTATQTAASLRSLRYAAEAADVGTAAYVLPMGDEAERPGVGRRAAPRHRPLPSLSQRRAAMVSVAVLVGVLLAGFGVVAWPHHAPAEETGAPARADVPAAQPKAPHTTLRPETRPTVAATLAESADRAAATDRSGGADRTATALRRQRRHTDPGPGRSRQHGDGPGHGRAVGHDAGRGGGPPRTPPGQRDLP